MKEADERADRRVDAVGPTGPGEEPAVPYSWA